MRNYVGFLRRSFIGSPSADLKGETFKFTSLVSQKLGITQIRLQSAILFRIDQRGSESRRSKHFDA